MDAVATVLAAVLAVVVGTLGGYIVGNRRLKYEHLHGRRAEVIAKLCELLAAVHRDVTSFVNPLQTSNVDRHEQAEEASRAFNTLVDYYRSNEVWLAPHTCERIETFLGNVSFPLEDYIDDLSERGYPQTPEGRALGIRILEETQPLRRGLISDFRAILYPPWYDAPLRFLDSLERRNRQEGSQE
jgi:hypothetical protein